MQSDNNFESDEKQCWVSVGKTAMLVIEAEGGLSEYLQNLMDEDLRKRKLSRGHSSVDRWIKERCILHEDLRLQVKVGHDDFLEWAKDKHMMFVPGIKVFSQAMKSAGFLRMRSGRVLFCGIGLDLDARLREKGHQGPALTIPIYNHLDHLEQK